MFKILRRIGVFWILAGFAASAGAASMSREQIIAEGEKVADAQLAQLASQKPKIDWIAAVMWAGYADFSHVSGKGAYRDAIEELGNQFHWTPASRKNDPNHADDLCICQTFLDAFETRSERLAPSQSRIDAVSDFILNKEDAVISGTGGARLTWWWCDALFMAPAAHARLTMITRNPAYMDAMDKEYWKTTALLYDKDAHLFSRDQTYLAKTAANGKKVFWSRGNGWVFAGLARTLTYMSVNFPSRPKYIALFREMAAELASLQQADGTWRPSLLDADEFPDSEMSGTALDCFAFAWGIENGILDRATYLPKAAKAWAAMLASRRPDGLPGYVQGVGAGPAAVYSNGTQLYVTGAFLMAATQLSKLAPFDLPAPPQLSAAPGQAPTPSRSTEAPAAAAQSGTFTKISDTVVDPLALTLSAHATYGSAINGQAFQEDIIHTSAGWQYVAGEGPAYPMALHAAYKWFPDEKRAIPGSIISQGSAFGVVVAVPLLNYIITTYNWHYAFGVLGLAGLVWVAAWAAFGKEGRIEHTATEGRAALTYTPYRILLLNPTNIASWCAYFSAYFGLALVLSWFTPYLVKGLGFEQAVAGKLTAIPFLVSFFVLPAGSWLSQHMMSRGSSSRVARGVFCGIAISLGGLALLATPYFSSAPMKIALIVAGTTLPSMVFILVPAIVGEFSPPSQRAALLGITSAVGTSAGVIAPYLMGSVIESAASAAEGYGTGFVICGVVTLIGGLIGLVFLHPENELAGFAARARGNGLLASG